MKVLSSLQTLIRFCFKTSYRPFSLLKEEVYTVSQANNLKINWMKLSSRVKIDFASVGRFTYRWKQEDEFSHLKNVRIKRKKIKNLFRQINISSFVFLRRGIRNTFTKTGMSCLKINASHSCRGHFIVNAANNSCVKNIEDPAKFISRGIMRNYHYVRPYTG